MRFAAHEDEENHAPRPSLADREPDEARWRRIYLAVVLFTILVIFSLWIFSRVFST